MPRKRTIKRTPQRPTKRTIGLPDINWSRGAQVVMGAVALAGIWVVAVWTMERPINALRIEAPFERVTAMQVEAAISAHLENNVLVSGLPELRQSIRALPWVHDASVRRSWPSTLHVSIVEERAAARWGEAGLLNVYGELFVDKATHIPAELPQLIGPPGSQLRVARQFFALDTQLEQRGLHATGLTLDERGAWSLQLSNGIEVRFGAAALEQRTKRFFEAFDGLLATDAEKINYVDMRYTNGFAIGWKPVDEMKLADNGETDPHA